MGVSTPPAVFGVYRVSAYRNAGRTRASGEMQLLHLSRIRQIVAEPSFTEHGKHGHRRLHVEQGVGGDYERKSESMGACLGDPSVLQKWNIV